jgi:integrase
LTAVLRDYLDEHMLRTSDDGYVFGSPQQVRRTSERGSKIWANAGLDPVALHDCRHTYASFMIAAGVNAKTICSYMGHANIAITFDLYGHLMPGSEAEPAELLDAFLARDGGRTSPVTSPDLAGMAA